eukprot:scaffold215905_cov35-Tisochrysis_lutea.AAC.2
MLRHPDEAQDSGRGSSKGVAQRLAHYAMASSRSPSYWIILVAHAAKRHSLCRPHNSMSSACQTCGVREEGQRETRPCVQMEGRSKMLKARVLGGIGDS